MGQELYFPLGLLLLVVGYLFFTGASFKPRKRVFLYMRIVIFLSYAGGVVYLAKNNQEAIAIGICVTSIPLGMKMARLNRRQTQRIQQTGFTEQTAVLQTDYVIVRVNQYTKAVNGEIVSGRFAGARLETLTFDDLISLLADYRAVDPRSAGVLRSYLDRTQPPDWKERAERKKAEAEGVQAPRKPVLGKDEAYAVLGLKEGATLEEIKLAHRTMMMKVHPDQGGTDYLAAMVNQAKEVLVG